MLEGSSLYLKDERDPARDAYETLAWQQAVRQVGKAVESLGERERQIIAWHYLEGLAFDQIAGLLGLSKGRIFTAATRQHLPYCASGCLLMAVSDWKDRGAARWPMKTMGYAPPNRWLL